jgi:hypothetical protein
VNTLSCIVRTDNDGLDSYFLTISRRRGTAVPIAVRGPYTGLHHAVFEPHASHAAEVDGMRGESAPGTTRKRLAASNVDQVTKGEVALELKKLFERIDIPVLLVTHGHEDAIYLGHQLAIMVAGKIEQVGTVKKVMQAPRTAFIKKLLRPFGDPG